MRARSVPFGSMFGWIPATFRLVRDNAGAMAVASLINLLAVAVLMAPLIYFEMRMFRGMVAGGMGMPQDMTGFWISYALCIGGSLLLIPPMIAGWFRLCADADRGAAVTGPQILGVYGDRGTWLRLVGLALLFVLLVAAVFGLLYLAFSGAFTEIIAMQAAQQAALATGGHPPPPSPALLGQIFLLYAIGIPTMVVLEFIYMVAFTEVSLRPTPILGAFGEAAEGVLRNLVKLLVFGFCFGVIAMFGLFLFALVIGVLMAVTMMISKVLGFIVIGLVYAAFLLLMYPLFFAGSYYVWKDMLGDDQAPGGGAVAA